MRILQISSAKNFGGGEKHLVDLTKGLQKKKHEVFVALRSKNDWEEQFSFLPEENIIHLPLRNSLDVFSAGKLAKLVGEKQIEILHAHLARDYPIAAIATRLRPVKLVFTRHLLLPLKRFHKLTASQVDCLIAVSHAVKKSLLEQQIFSPEKIKLILNGTEIESFNQGRRHIDKENLQKHLQISHETFLVGTVGELKNIKGQDLFLQAAALVAEKFPNAHFIIAGADNLPQKNHEKRLKNLVSQLNLNDRAHFVGWIKDVGSLMRGLDVFVSAARTEPFGLVLIEAMACRRAVVATETEGASEILRPGETGQIVPKENPQAIAEAIIEFLSNEQMRETFGKNAFEEAREKFSLERMVTETEKLYREISDVV